MRDSDWSRKFLLRSDWSGPKGATITTHTGSKIYMSAPTSVLQHRKSYLFLILDSLFNEKLIYTKMKIKKINHCSFSIFYIVGV